MTLKKLLNWYSAFQAPLCLKTDFLKIIVHSFILKTHYLSLQTRAYLRLPTNLISLNVGWQSAPMMLIAQKNIRQFFWKSWQTIWQKFWRVEWVFPECIFLISETDQGSSFGADTFGPIDKNSNSRGLLEELHSLPTMLCLLTALLHYWATTFTSYHT